MADLSMGGTPKRVFISFVIFIATILPITCARFMGHHGKGTLKQGQNCTWLTEISNDSTCTLVGKLT